MELELFKNILKYIKNNEKEKRSLLNIKTCDLHCVSKSTVHGQPILSCLGYLFKMQTLALQSRPTQSEYMGWWYLNMN